MLEEKKVGIWMKCINHDKKIDISTEGKWIIHGKLKYFKKIFPEIKALVDQGVIRGAKYKHEENILLDFFPYSESVLCVYADDYTKELVFRELETIGLKPERWKYDSETAEEWGIERLDKK
jgi:hypothetical protein